MKNDNFKKLCSSLALVATSALTACGGGGGGGSTASPAGISGSAAPNSAAAVTAPVTGTASTGVSTTTPTVVMTPPVVAAMPVYTLATPPGSTYVLGTAQRVMFDSLNQIRIGGGFGALEQDTRLDQSAKAHADYALVNYYPNGVRSEQLNIVQPDGWFTAYTELSGTDGFTGTRPASRIASTGYQAVNTGKVMGGQFGSKVGVEPDMSICLSALLNTVFHRAALLDTTYLDIGFGISKSVIDKNGFVFRVCVIDFAAKKAPPVWRKAGSVFIRSTDKPICHLL